MDGVKAAKVWRYSIPNEKFQGWAIIFLDSEGCFAALSDYGDHSYRWNARGFPPGLDFRQFIIQCDDGYLTGKLGQGKREYDPEATLAGVRETIIECRKEKSFTKEHAREEWDSLDGFDNLQTEHDFGRWHDYTDIGDASESYRTRYPRDLQSFIQFVMPKLRALIQAELKSDDNAVAY